MRVAFLGYNQPVGGVARPLGGYLSKHDAALLVRDLAAERISNREIRQFAPGTAFRHLGVPPAPKHWTSAEIPGCIFREPQSPTWQNEHAAPSRNLKTKARLMRLALGYDKPKEVYA